MNGKNSDDTELRLRATAVGTIALVGIAVSGDTCPARARRDAMVRDPSDVMHGDDRNFKIKSERILSFRGRKILEVV